LSNAASMYPGTTRTLLSQALTSRQSCTPGSSSGSRHRTAWAASPPRTMRCLCASKVTQVPKHAAAGEPRLQVAAQAGKGPLCRGCSFHAQQCAAHVSCGASYVCTQPANVEVCSFGHILISKGHAGNWIMYACCAGHHSMLPMPVPCSSWPDSTAPGCTLAPCRYTPNLLAQQFGRPIHATVFRDPSVYSYGSALGWSQEYLDNEDLEAERLFDYGILAPAPAGARQPHHIPRECPWPCLSDIEICYAHGHGGRAFSATDNLNLFTHNKKLSCLCDAARMSQD
jgi:hypothetical protein